MSACLFRLKNDSTDFTTVFQLDFEIFRTIASFIKISSGHSLIIKLIFIKFFRTIWEIGGQMSWDQCLAESLHYIMKKCSLGIKQYSHTLWYILGNRIMREFWRRLQKIERRTNWLTAMAEQQNLNLQKRNQRKNQNQQ